MQTVLIADDDPSVHELLGEFLDLTRTSLVSAYDGMEALRLVERENPDVIVLDSVMPLMNGHEVLSRLGELKAERGFFIVVFSARDGSEFQARARELGADEYVVKPASMSKLAEMIESYLARRKT
jgi:DNA-binding response OmpR family regulator